MTVTKRTHNRHQSEQGSEPCFLFGQLLVLPGCQRQWDCRQWRVYLLGTCWRVQLERLSPFDGHDQHDAGINIEPCGIAESRRELFSARFRESGELQPSCYLDQAGSTRGHLFKRCFKQLCRRDDYFGRRNQKLDVARHDLDP